MSGCKSLYICTENIQPEMWPAVSGWQCACARVSIMTRQSAILFTLQTWDLNGITEYTQRTDITMREVHVSIFTCKWRARKFIPISWRVLGLNKLKHPSLTAFCSFAADTRKVERRRTTSCLQEQTALSKGVRSAINWCPNVQTAPRARLLVSRDMSDHWLTHAFFLAVSLFHSGADRRQRMTATTKRRQARGCGIRRQQTANNACNTKGAKTRGKHGMKRKESDS